MYRPELAAVFALSRLRPRLPPDLLECVHAIARIMPAGVAAGSNHSLALFTDGSVVGWGHDEDGQCSGGGAAAAAWEPGEYNDKSARCYVREKSDLQSAVVVELKVGRWVRVLEVVRKPHGSTRVFGRSDDPAGWISFKDLDDGYQW
eukprot:gene14302-18835_t